MGHYVQHRLWRASAAINAKGDSAVLVPCDPLDQRVLHPSVSQVVMSWAMAILTFRAEGGPRCHKYCHNPRHKSLL